MTQQVVQLTALYSLQFLICPPMMQTAVPHPALPEPQQLQGQGRLAHPPPPPTLQAPGSPGTRPALTPRPRRTTASAPWSCWPTVMNAACTAHPTLPTNLRGSGRVGRQVYLLTLPFLNLRPKAEPLLAFSRDGLRLASPAIVDESRHCLFLQPLRTRLSCPLPGHKVLVRPLSLHLPWPIVSSLRIHVTSPYPCLIGHTHYHSTGCWTTAAAPALPGRRSCHVTSAWR